MFLTFLGHELFFWSSCMFLSLPSHACTRSFWPTDCSSGQTFTLLSLAIIIILFCQFLNFLSLPCHAHFCLYLASVLMCTCVTQEVVFTYYFPIKKGLCSRRRQYFVVDKLVFLAWMLKCYWLSHIKVNLLLLPAKRKVLNRIFVNRC